MEITTKVCDICYCNGYFNEQEKLYDCGELGDLCEKHFTKAYNFLTEEKRNSALMPTMLVKDEDSYITKGTDTKTGEEVAVTFDADKSKSNSYENLSKNKKKLPWL